jgi:hypothetical protein
MNRILAWCAAFVVVQGVAGAQVRDLDLGLSFADGSLRGFYLTISDHYGVPARQVVELQQRYRCPVDELPVVYFLSARAHVAPAVIIGLRAGRMSWLDIAFHYHLRPDIFFVPVSAERIGPPYGRAYGYYRKQGPSRDPRAFAITDSEVVDLVNLRFLSEHYGVRPETVMAMRSEGRPFVAIAEAIGHGKDAAKAKHHNERSGHKK